jgi:serine O-acetyltransferase
MGVFIENKKGVSYSVCLKDNVADFTKQLYYALFDEIYQQENLIKIKKKFFEVLKRLSIDNVNILWNKYESKFSEIRMKLDLDAIAFERTDPACKSLEEVYLAYPGFYAIAIYRLSHELEKLRLETFARMMSEYAHSVTGTDIHPGADIGASFFIDHATGTVIGETTIIKNNVKIYQGVTLGGIQVKKSLAATKRHPTIEDNVTIYANATILGGDVVIGANSIIGANVCVMNSVPENVTITAQSENKIKKNKI